MDELRASKDKVQMLLEKQRKEESTNRSQFEHMMKLQEKLKDLQYSQQPAQATKIHSAPVTIEALTKEKDELSNQLNEAQKNIDLITKAREVDQKRHKQIFKQMKGQIGELEAKVDLMVQ